MSATTKKPTEFKVQTVCLVVLTAFAIGAGLYFLRTLLVPFTLAIFFALLLSPLLDLQVRKLRVPRPVALVITLLVGFAIISVLGGIVATSVARLASNAEEYQEKVETQLIEVAQRLPLERLGLDPDEDFDPLSFIPEGFTRDTLLRSTGAIAGALSQGLLVMLFVIFLLLGSTTRTKRREGVAGEIERSVKRYVVTKVIASAVTGTLVYFVLQLLGIPFAIAFGAFAFVLNFIPSVGSIVATFIPLPVILLTPDITVQRIILAIAIPGAIQFAIGSIIEPKILGDSLDLHPVVILLALIFWGMLWGPIGMLLAAPLTAVTKIALSKLDVTAPVADLLAGRLDAFESGPS